MKTFLNSAGVLLIAAGISTLILFAFSSGLVVIGLTPELSAVLAIGGLMSMGISAVIAALERQTAATYRAAGLAPGVAAAPSAASAPGAVKTPAAASTPAATAGAATTNAMSNAFAGLSRATASASSRKEPQVTTPRANNEESLARKFRAVAAAAGSTAPPDDKLASAKPGAGRKPETEGDAVPISEEDLYVVSERMIAGRQARILSDDTVEAETDEGWMRFENVEHLEEYLGANRKV